MFRCKECNTEYKIKPDYCDCGNDTFDYIEEKQIKQPLTLEQKSEIVSRIFFVICLLIAIGVWFIPMSKKTTSAKQTVTKPKIHTSIPDINKIWNDTPIYQPKPQQTITEPIILTPTGNTPAQKKNIINTPVKDVKPKIQPKTTQKLPAPKTETAKENVPVKVTETPKKVEQPKPVYNPNSPAMIEYKTKLRATLFSKFAVGSIQGAGTCSISFSVDKNGKLINRKFTRQSDNKSLNDTVYYMLMSVPYFSTPPTEYNGETIRMNFSVNNGDYEISIH